MISRFKPKKRIEISLQNRLLSWINWHFNEIVKRANTVQEVLNELDTLTHSPAWEKIAYDSALQMVRRVAVENALDWREAAQKSSNGFRIFQQLKAELHNNGPFRELTRRNANLFKTLPGDLARSVVQHTQSEAVRGKRPEAVLADIRARAPHLAEWQCRRIARTEVSKTWAAVTQTRSQSIGVHWYEWSGSLDARERASHKHLEGVLINYNNPPSPEALLGIKSNLGTGNAGFFPNCRCTAIPVGDADEVSWPHKVYYNGRIQLMAKKTFLAIQ
jgi:SPP1 gp7 family putative phage head morphogenesis protein